MDAKELQDVSVKDLLLAVVRLHQRVTSLERIIGLSDYHARSELLDLLNRNQYGPQDDFPFSEEEINAILSG